MALFCAGCLKNDPALDIQLQEKNFHIPCATGMSKPLPLKGQTKILSSDVGNDLNISFSLFSYAQTKLTGNMTLEP